MSVERRKPLALLHSNAKPTDASHATTSLTISRPRRQMPAYHYQYQHQQGSQKRFATMLPGSSRSSATSSAESLYSSVSSMPRLRKLSAAEDVAARVRARWAALEALEKARESQPADNTITATTTGHTDAGAGAEAPIFGRRWRRLPARAREGETEPEPEPEPEKEREKENAVPMQVDGYEKPLPLPPRPPALALRIMGPEPASPPPRTAPATATTAPTLMVVDVCDDDDEDEDRDKDGGGPTPHSDAGAEADAGAGPGPGAVPGVGVPASDSTLRTTPTSLTFVETQSLRPILQRRRPTRAVTPPQVRRRPSVTDELEEAREEATMTMLRSPRTDGLLCCPRRGCDELLTGVRALTFHLHIHAVGAGAYACLRCGGAFESARDLARHACARRRARERLRRAVRAWTCISSTGQNLGKQQAQQQGQVQQVQQSRHYKRDDNHYY